MRERRVQPDRRHAKRERAEEREQRRAQAPRTQLSIEHLHVRHDPHERQVRPLPDDEPAYRLRQRLDARRRPEHEAADVRTRRQERRHWLLRERHEVLHQMRFVVHRHDGSLPCVARHANDLTARHFGRWRRRSGREFRIEVRIEADPDALANGALPRPHLPRHRLIDDDDERTAVVRRRESAALDDLDVKNLEQLRRRRDEKRQSARRLSAAPAVRAR